MVWVASGCVLRKQFGVLASLGCGHHEVCVERDHVSPKKLW